MKVSEGFMFSVTRNADIELREDHAGDLLRSLDPEFQRLYLRFPVRLEVSADMPDKMLKLLVSGIGLTDQDVYKIEVFLDIPDLMQLYTLDRPLLKERPIMYVHPAVLTEGKSYFDIL